MSSCMYIVWDPIKSHNHPKHSIHNGTNGQQPSEHAAVKVASPTATHSVFCYITNWLIINKINKKWECHHFSTIISNKSWSKLERMQTGRSVLNCCLADRRTFFHLLRLSPAIGLILNNECLSVKLNTDWSPERFCLYEIFPDVFCKKTCF